MCYYANYFVPKDSYESHDPIQNFQPTYHCPAQLPLTNKYFLSFIYLKIKREKIVEDGKLGFMDEKTAYKYPHFFKSPNKCSTSQKPHTYGTISLYQNPKAFCSSSQFSDSEFLSKRKSRL